MVESRKNGSRLPFQELKLELLGHKWTTMQLIATSNLTMRYKLIVALQLLGSATTTETERRR